MVAIPGWIRKAGTELMWEGFGKLTFEGVGEGLKNYIKVKFKERAEKERETANLLVFLKTGMTSEEGREAGNTLLNKHGDLLEKAKKGDVDRLTEDEYADFLVQTYMAAKKDAVDAAREDVSDQELRQRIRQERETMMILLAEAEEAGELEQLQEFVERQAGKKFRQEIWYLFIQFKKWVGGNADAFINWANSEEGLGKIVDNLKDWNDKHERRQRLRGENVIYAGSGLSGLWFHFIHGYPYKE